MNMYRKLRSFLFLPLIAGGFGGATSQAALLITSDPAAAAGFMAGTTVENFDDLTAFVITSYDPGQTIDAGAKFSSRNGATQPTYHSGGASPSDPVGNPGSPVGIFAPQGAIAADVASIANVLGPLVIFTDEPFNNGFLEVIFPNEAARVGFWVTSGAVSLDLRDDMGLTLTTGDASATVSAGQFVGITRDAPDVKIAALIGNGTDHFTIDDFTYSAVVPEPGSMASLALAGAILLLRRRRGSRSFPNALG
ncbi:MAG TPA: PEP-CTERM sorting domain-containing protein [Verrucomicrobiales bacterium]|nr:PEP-CTERM sorting domain-containing protein [Verrucomicrobiales bacterium]